MGTRLEARLRGVLASIPAPGANGTRAEKKNYTEALSSQVTEALADAFREAGLPGVRAPRGRDKQFMGGYGTKGVDAYLSDEKHGLLLSSGTKGLLYDVPKNLKNRYRDMVMEALELHKRFPYAVCGHLLFLGKSEADRTSKAFGTVLGEAVALLQGISGRTRPDEPPELYEVVGVTLLDPGEPESLDLYPSGVPEALQGGRYVDRMVRRFRVRTPFYRP
ncbi:hypothetical protein [Deferrisoma camini]|uniref:hypothetical protein n=1 Tax=Deferrisoma camini TaxID=1035120 RepID=UPI00046CCCDB|nr:hypothetical protein [Deferrisoma camini]